MGNMYNMLSMLLARKGISGAKMCTDLGMSRSFMTELRKGRAKSTTPETAQKLADYFGVSLEYLFEHTLQAQIDVAEHMLVEMKKAYNKANNDLDREEILIECSLINERLADLRFASAHLPPADIQSVDQQKVSDDDIKFALFGGDGEITDAMYEEVKRFAQMVKLREEAEKNKE